MFTLLGMALGGWMSGKIFDLTTSYHAAFINGIAWNLLNLTIAITLLRRAQRQRPIRNREITVTRETSAW
jgi:cyanate permease